APVGGQLLHPFQRDTEVPADAGQLVGPADAIQPVAQVVQVSLGDLDAEGRDGGHGCLLDCVSHTNVRLTNEIRLLVGLTQALRSVPWRAGTGTALTRPTRPNG